MCNTAVNSCARAPFPRHDEDDGMVITETLSLFVSCLYLCSRVAYEAYENVPNPTKKRKWAKNEEEHEYERRFLVLLVSEIDACLLHSGL